MSESEPEPPVSAPAAALRAASDGRDLRVAGAWLQALADGSKEVVALLEPDGTVQYLSVSGAVQEMLGYEALEIMAMTPVDLVHPLDLPRLLDAFRTVAAHPGGRMTLEFRGRHRSGHYVNLESTAVNRTRNEFIGAIVVHTRELFHGGPITPPSPSAPPVPTFAADDELAVAVEEAIAKNRTDKAPFAVLVFELQRADVLIEAYGEETATALLAQLGRRLHDQLRPGDRLAQLHTQQFAILLEGVGDRTLVERIAARIQRTVGDRFGVRGTEITAPTAVGIVTSERPYQRAEDVVRDASLAAAAARGGRQRRAVFRTHMHVERARHMSLMTELHNALHNEELRVHYLPIIGLASRTLSGFEALVRWQHPERGLISPDLFVPVAEESGLIVAIGRFVLREACRQMAQWNGRYAMDPALSLSVNVASKQFADFDLHEQVETLLQETGLDPHNLVLEVGEQAVLEQRDAVGEALRRVQKLGVRAALDNFGVGASSFVFLHQLPIERLKIDRSLVAGLSEREGRGRDIVNALIGLAHNLRLEVVAEGVETPHQAAQLSKMWCEYAQGYLFGKPMSSDAAGAFIAAYPRWWEG